MNSRAEAAPPTMTPSGLIRSAAVAGALAIGLYFVVKYVPQYFVLTEESYGP
jgi:hypothetical protein